MDWKIFVSVFRLWFPRKELEIPLDEKEHEKLRQSAAELKKVLETLDL